MVEIARENEPVGGNVNIATSGVKLRTPYSQ